MRYPKTFFAVLLILMFLGHSHGAQGQFLKKLKKNIEQKLSDKVEGEVDKVLEGKGSDHQRPGHKDSISDVRPKEEISGERNLETERNKDINPNRANKNILTYEAPSENFKSIIIQSHKGLPRFGRVFQRRGSTDELTIHAYEELLRLKYLDVMYGDMDRDILTMLTRPDTYSMTDNDKQKRENSLEAQQSLLKIAEYIAAEELIAEYFCNPERQKSCQNVGGWAGLRNNEFQQMKSYSGFVKNHFGELLEWSETFFEDDVESAYFVSQSNIMGQYDFNKKGYWINLMDSYESGWLLGASQLMPSIDAEKHLKEGRLRTFFEIGPEEARELQLKESHPIYSVYRVKVFPKVLHDNDLRFEFKIENQTLELYKDAQLREKIGEFDYTNNLQLK